VLKEVESGPSGNGGGGVPSSATKKALAGGLSAAAKNDHKGTAAADSALAKKKNQGAGALAAEAALAEDPLGYYSAATDGAKQVVFATKKAAKQAAAAAAATRARKINAIGGAGAGALFASAGAQPSSSPGGFFDAYGVVAGGESPFLLSNRDERRLGARSRGSRGISSSSSNSSSRGGPTEMVSGTRYAPRTRRLFLESRSGGGGGGGKRSGSGDNFKAGSREEVNVALMPDRLHPNAAGFAPVLRCISDALA
jgi:hypothetical protein